MKIFIATKNLKKLAELERILIPMGFDVVSERDLENEIPEVEETGTTFEENALLKARSGLKATGLITVADDSGLCVDALGGAPGVYSARYSDHDATDQKNIEKLLLNLKDVEDDKRTAKFECCIACVFPSGNYFTVNGECTGYISRTPHGNNGFGYDPVFISEKGCFAELTKDEKDAVSHRGKALEKFKTKMISEIKKENK